ncbi:MAG: PAS domain-containing sensor histidine kinase [Ilumatobacteraceae bacterium]|nr:PAS domain S-box protein [Acidimicrobiales bacterium]MCB9395924.1 PAS domain-containing sensor histidine kinase [Acidimicrobiaceae bacterium]
MTSTLGSPDWSSGELFHALIDSVQDYAIYALDTRGCVATWNPGAERLKGYRADEVVGRHFSIFYGEEDRDAGVPDMLLRIALTDERVEREGWRVRRDGSRFWANVVITALRDQHGAHRGFVKVTKDLTDRKRNEDALRAAVERERAAADRLRELDHVRTTVFEFVAHDLRAPLGVVQQLAHLLRSEWSVLPDVVKLDYLERIAVRSSAMGDLVTDLLDAVRLDAGQLQLESRPVAVADVVRGALADAFADADRVRLDLDEHACALADHRRLRQVLVNLLTNAAKYSPAGAPIEVRVEGRPGTVRISIADHGPGIPDSDRDLLFQRFSRLTTGRSTAGNGIGLYIAKSLVDAQGGHIGVHTGASGGSTFTVSLPAAP